jgi:hypothetical protein
MNLRPLSLSLPALTAMLACASIAPAATYYVAPRATSTNWTAATSQATPCTTSTAMVNAVAGDTVYFLAGTYEIPDTDPRYGRTHYHAFLEPYNSGTAEAPITFAAYPGATVVLNGTVSDSDELVRVFSTCDQDYLVFDGFIIQANNGAKMGSIIVGYDSGTWTQTAVGCVIRNCTFTGGTDIITSTDNRECIRIEWSQDTVVSNCRIAHVRQSGGEGQVDWHNTSAIKLYHTRNTIIEHCDISDCSEGIYDKSDGNGTIIRYNFIHDNAEGLLFASFVDGNYSHDNCSAYHNVFAGNKQCISDVTEEVSHSHNLTLRHNTLYADPASTTASSGIIVNAGTGKRVGDNLIYGRRQSTDVGLLRFYATTGVPCTIAECDYNLFGPSSQFLIRRHGQTGSYFSYSTLAAWQASNALESGAAPDQHSLVAAPQFANGSGTMTAAADFRLLPASPGYQAGSDGKDIGADTSLVGILLRDTVAPTAPTGLAGSASSATTIALIWTASTDNVGVTGYRVYRNGSQIGTTTSTAYIDIGLITDTTYSYQMVAFDAVGNASPASTPISVIAHNPGTTILWRDDFDDGLPLTSKYEDVSTNGLAVSSLDSCTGGNALTQTYTTGQVDAGWVVKYRPSGFPDRVFMRWYHKFETGFQGFPPKMARIRARNHSTWTSALAVHCWIETDGVVALDVAAVDSTQANADGWLPIARSGFSFATPTNIGRWVCFEMEVQLNTPGSADGAYRLWIDDTLAVERTGVDLRGSQTYSLNECMLDCYWNGGSSRPQRRFYDSLIIATAKIGPDPDPATYSAWRTANFSGADLTNDAISGPDADPDGCGLTNLARYAFDLPTRGPAASPIALTISGTGSNQRLTLTFPRKDYAPDLHYTIQSSTDLVNWTNLQTVAPGYPKTFTFTDSVAIGSAQRRFLRVQVAQVIPIDDAPVH